MKESKDLRSFPRELLPMILIGKPVISRAQSGATVYITRGGVGWVRSVCQIGLLLFKIKQINKIIME